MSRIGKTPVAIPSGVEVSIDGPNVAVKGPKDHHFVDSIYFYDPNGIRLELTAWKDASKLDRPSFLKEEAAVAHERLDAWTEEKQAKRQAAE